jgi:nucleoside-diphosphate-sugar epimerase
MSSRPASDLNGRRLLLTGHRGFIGSSLLEALQRHGCAVSTFPGDVTAPDAWAALKEEFDFVLHLAAVENEPSFERELSVNALSVLNLARRIASLKKKPKVIFTSTTNIWGCRTDAIVDEQTIDAPTSIWSVHKLLAENYLRAFREFGVESVILRLPNIVGECANMNVIARSAVNRAIEDCLLNKKLTVYANKNCIRDYLDVSDLVEMLLQTIRWFDELSQHAKVIIGSGQCIPIVTVWSEIARQYEKLTGAKIEIRENTSTLSAFAMRSYVTSNALASRILGYRPQVSIEDSIRGTMQHLIGVHKSNPFAETVNG